MTRFPDVFAALAAPFLPHELKQRSGGGGRQLTYITATTAANRLDTVLGPEAWDFEVKPWGDNALIGTITVRLPDGTVFRKTNVGGCAGMQADDDDAKSAASDCLKRCAMLLGVGRYLYRDGSPVFYPGEVQESPTSGVDATERRPQPPNAPPTQERPESPQEGSQGQSRPSYDGPDRPPTSGRALFAWVKKQEEQHDEGLLKYLNGWGKLQEFPSRMVDWDVEQVKRAHAEAVRKLQSVGKSEGEPPSARDEDRPGPFPDNRSGYGRGQYASPDQVAEYLAKLNQFVEDRNQEWLDEWVTPGGMLPEGIGEFLRAYQITHHMLKWGLRMGRLAEVGVTYDAETGKPVEDVPQPKADKYVAILAHRHREEFNAEVLRYAREQADRARAKWMDKHGESTEAGSRG